MDLRQNNSIHYSMEDEFKRFSERGSRILSDE
jgi:hypothetical protein